jgi:hypothetical protein
VSKFGDDLTSFFGPGSGFVSPTGAIRGADGRFVPIESMTRREYDEAIDQQVGLIIGERFATANQRGIPGLGTYRSRRRAEDLRRQRERTPACMNCGGSLAGLRSNAKTCSNRCRQALDRARRLPNGAAVRNASAANMN